MTSLALRKCFGPLKHRFAVAVLLVVSLLFEPSVREKAVTVSSVKIGPLRRPTEYLQPFEPFPINYAGDQPRGTSQIIDDPYPDYNSAAWKETQKGTYQPCLGPHGHLLNRRSEDTMMSGYHWNSSDFPTPIFGSYESWGLDQSRCTDRYSRYGAYGYAAGSPGNWTSGFGSNEAAEVSWEKVNWASLQQNCLQRNADRYRTADPQEKTIWTLDKQFEKKIPSRPNRLLEPGVQPRNAVILRSWLGMKYTANDLHHIRPMVMELSLYSGGEYEVILFVDCQGKTLPGPRDTVAMESFKKRHLPAELREMAVVFNEKMLADWYPGIDTHVAILQYYQPVQIFSRLHPQYDYIWQFEMDSRYTGHLYHLLRQATEFAKRQPRKHLWERNSYFYIPAVHGTWEELTNMVDKEVSGHDSVWGPRPAEGIDVEEEASVPPVPNPDDDARSWGVGEEADLITWLPHFNPAGVEWPFRGRIFNFPQGENMPRRAAVVAMSRVSARLLRLLHTDKAEKGVGLASEMSLASWALFYGLKAVQVPQPLFHDYAWDPAELNRRANSGDPRGEVNAGFTSMWSWNQHHDILFNTTFMFRSAFAEKLYRAWLGYGEAENWEKENSRLCLPPMLLHPVKNVEPVKTVELEL